jgi:hypothetical protein
MSTARDMYSVDINEASQAIHDVGHRVSILIEGHMGFGKTAILYMLGEMPKFKDFTLCYFDCTTKDVGDLFIPDFFRIDGESKCVRFIPNEEFGIHLGKPVIIMVDEIGKAFPTVKNAMNRVFLERSIGTFKLPEGSIVFATTNLLGENVGDLFPAHSNNRVTTLRMRKSTVDEWLHWGINKKIHPTVLTFVKEEPSVFESFEDIEIPSDNPYIFHPKRSTSKCVTGRSLEKASDILWDGKDLSTSVLTGLLIGTLGERGGMDLMRTKALADKLPTRKEIMDDPENCKLPDNASAKVLLVYRALTSMDREFINPWMIYMDRLAPEEQGYFARHVNRSGYKYGGVVMTNKKYMEWSRSNTHLFSADKL